MPCTQRNYYIQHASDPICQYQGRRHVLVHETCLPLPVCPRYCIIRARDQSIDFDSYHIHSSFLNVGGRNALIPLSKKKQTPTPILLRVAATIHACHEERARPGRHQPPPCRPLVYPCQEIKSKRKHAHAPWETDARFPFPGPSSPTKLTNQRFARTRRRRGYTYLLQPVRCRRRQREMHAEAEVEAGARRTTTGRSCRCPRPSRYVRAARDHRARVSTRSRHRRRRRAGPKAARLESVRDDDDRDAPDARLSDCAGACVLLLAPAAGAA